MEIRAFAILFLFAVYLTMFLMDVAIFFLLVRLLSYAIPARPLLSLDQIGGRGVDVVTGAIWHHVRRWCNRPLSDRQEEAVALFVLSVSRFVLGVIVKCG